MLPRVVKKIKLGESKKKQNKTTKQSRHSTIWANPPEHGPIKKLMKHIPLTE